MRVGRSEGRKVGRSDRPTLRASDLPAGSGVVPRGIPTTIVSALPSLATCSSLSCSSCGLRSTICRVRQVAQRRGLAAGSLQRGKSFLPGLHQVREDLLQLSWQREVADSHALHVQSPPSLLRSYGEARLRACAPGGPDAEPRVT